ncbi:MAG TPA: hypothetical protein VH650_13780 [Gaiellaceae bacterium]
MKRLAVIARLRERVQERAAELLAQGPPFDPREIGFERHSVYMSGDQVVFVFEGGDLDRLLRTVVKDAGGSEAFSRWEDLVEGVPRVAQEVYSWERGDEWPEGWGE